MIKYKEIDSELEIIEEKENKKEDVSSIKKLLQLQICHEFMNERQYLAMAVWCENNDYTETASFYIKRSSAKRKQGLEFINYMSKRKMGAHAPLNKPIEYKFKDIKTLLRASLEGEIATTSMVKEMNQEALKESDLILSITVDYMKEQVNTEQLFISLLNLYNKCDGSKIKFEREVGYVKDKEKYIVGSL